MKTTMATGSVTNLAHAGWVDGCAPRQVYNEVHYVHCAGSTIMVMCHLHMLWLHPARQVYNKPMGKHLMGIFYGGHAQLLLCQVIAILVIVGWTGA